MWFLLEEFYCLRLPIKNLTVHCSCALLVQDVVFVATRKIVRPPKKGSAVQRPRTRTLTAVHDGILEDVVYPAEIVGKRIRYRLDGAKVIKVNVETFEHID
jgi:hypothetical protein